MNSSGSLRRPAPGEGRVPGSHLYWVPAPMPVLGADDPVPPPCRPPPIDCVLTPESGVSGFMLSMSFSIGIVAGAAGSVLAAVLASGVLTVLEAGVMNCSG